MYKVYLKKVNFLKTLSATQKQKLSHKANSRPKWLLGKYYQTFRQEITAIFHILFKNRENESLY